MKNLKTPLLLIAFLIILNIGCTKDEMPIKEEPIEQGEEQGEEETEEEVEEEEVEEEIQNPDLDLVGGQGAFTITPGSGIMSGETSVNLKIIFDDLKTQIPNDSLDYRIEWKTNGAYGSFEDEGNEADMLDVDGVTYTSINTETTTGEEKFRATLYSRPKGSNETFTLNGSALTSLSILNELNKKYFVLTPIYTVTFLANEPCTAGASDVRNWLDSAIYVNEIANAKSYSLKITAIVSGPSKYDLWDTKTAPDLFYSWNQDNTSYNNTNTNPAVSNAAFTFSLAATSTNTCNPDYSDSVGWVSGTRGIGQLTVTLE